jgi:DNA-binding PadR family transcriptional regulator
MALNHAIMTALLEDRLSGYELTKSFDTSLGFFWKASHQQIYKCLRELQAQGLLAGEEVAQAGRPDKIVYQLTPAGRDELDNWVAGEGQLRESKDDLFVKLYNLSEKNLPHIRRELDNRAQRTRARLALYRQIRERRYQHPESLPLRQRGIYLALLAGIGHCEQLLAWIDSCETLLPPR